MVIDPETLPSVITPELSSKLGDALKEMSNNMYKIEALKDHQKSIAKRMKEEYDIPTSKFNKLARLYHSASFAQKSAEDQEFYDFAQALFSQIGAPGLPEDIEHP